MSVSDQYYNHPHVAAQIFPNYEAAVLDGLGDAEALKHAFATLPGGGTLYGDLVDLIRVQTELRLAEAERRARPYAIALALFSFGGIMLGLTALLRRS